MEDCIFCKISAGELNTEFLYEDDDCVVFRDIHPKAPTHLLIVSRKHIDSVAEMEEVDAGLMGRMVLRARDVAKDLNLPGYNLQINVGKEGGQEIFHIHIHLMSKFNS